MSVDVLSEITISRPRMEVASFAADPVNAPAWYVNIKAIEWKSTPPMRIGSRVAFVGHVIGEAF